MLPYLKLIKFDSLLLIIFAQLCVKYGLFAPFDVDVALDGIGITLLIIATIAIVAATNVMQEIQDQDTTTNKGLIRSHITEKTAHNLFLLFNSMGVAIGFYISYHIGKPKLAAICIVISGIFYIYETYLKEIIVIKNLIIANMAVVSLLIVGVFDLLPAITSDNLASQKIFFLILIDYAIFGFVIVFIREIIKDCIRIDKDLNNNMQTIPLVLGKTRTTKLLSILTVIPIAMVVYYIYTYLFSNTLAVILVLGLLIAPLLLFMFKSWVAETNNDFKTLSILLKIILCLAAASLLVYQFILQ